MKSFFIILVLIFQGATIGFAQQNPIPISNRLLPKPSPQTRVTFSPAIHVLTYGGAISIPALWIENRIRVVPLVGLFWKDYTRGGQVFNPAVGADIFYVFNHKPLGAVPSRFFYAGVGGMSNSISIDQLGRNIARRSRVDAILGYFYTVSPLLKLAPEIRLGLRHTADETTVGAGAGVVIQF